jgi:hypothetical protein
MKPTPTLLAAILIVLSPAASAQEGKACELLSPEEIQATVGAKPNLKASVLPSGVEVCSGRAGSSTVTIRLYAKKDEAEQEKEAARIDGLKKAGASVETRRVAGYNCMGVRPGGKAAREPYRTSCATNATSKAPRYAVIEVSNPSTSLEMRKLAPLAESIAARLY